MKNTVRTLLAAAVALATAVTMITGCATKNDTVAQADYGHIAN
ncbi:MAG TPA: hypothetical protein VMU04_23560 [Candidatus Acidoferrum sp.]|nr:hypothetical protein [Candidatus Acidoferrum sp.]